MTSLSSARAAASCAALRASCAATSRWRSASRCACSCARRACSASSANAFELGAETRVGLGSDAGDFGFERAGGRFLRGALRFLRRRLAQRLRFDRALRLFLLRLLLETFELALQARVGLAARRGRPRPRAAARGRFFGGALGFLRRLLARLLGVALRLLLRAAGLLGVLANALELALETGIRVAADARDFGLDRGGGRLLRGLAGLAGFGVARLLGLEMRLFLCESRRLGFLAQALDLGLHLGFGLGA